MLAKYFCKMILDETGNKTYNSEFLAIVKGFKLSRHYLNNSKYKVLVFTNQNNLYHFMDTKSLCSH